MHNPTKPGGMFTVDERVRADPRAPPPPASPTASRSIAHGGLAVDAARDAGADFIVKGLRNAGDFEIEQQMAHTNHAVTGVRTVYLPCRTGIGVHQQPLHPRDRPVRWRRSTTWCRHRWPPPLSARFSRRDRVRRQRRDDDDDDHDEYYDDYEEIDDEYPDARATDGYVGDAETLLRRAIDIIATAPTMPLSSSPRIDRDEIIELLEEALQRLPDELRQARWMLKERQEFVAKTRREADELLEAARVQAERMVQRTEVVRAAEQRARQVMRGRRDRLAPPAPRDRGLPRPAPRQLRDPARQAAEDRRRRPSAAVDRCDRPRRPAAIERRRPHARASSTRTADVRRPDACHAARQRRRTAAPARLAAPPVECTVDAGRGRRRRPRRGRPARRRGRPRHHDRRRHRRRAPSPSPWRGACRRCLTPLAERASRRRRTSSTSRRSPTDDDAFADRRRPDRPRADGPRGGAARPRRRAAVPRRLRRAVPDVRRTTSQRRRRATATADRRSTSAGRRSTRLREPTLPPVACRRSPADNLCNSPICACVTETSDGRSQEEEVEVEEPQPPRRRLEARARRRAACARAAATPSCRTRCARPAAGTRTASPSTSAEPAAAPSRCCRSRSTRWAATGPPARSSPAPGAPPTIGIPVVLVGPPDLARRPATSS